MIEVRIQKKDNGELSMTLIDFETKIKSEFSHEELKVAIDKPGSFVWMSNIVDEKCKEVIRK